MSERQKELLEYLFELSLEYYSEKTDKGSFKIPDNQSEKQFIQEVFTSCGEILNKFD